jgi:hypothetical protein
MSIDWNKPALAGDYEKLSDEEKNNEETAFVNDYQHRSRVWVTDFTGYGRRRASR